MNMLYPLKFKPIFKEKIWGGQKAKTIYGFDFSPLPNCGEVWLLSAYPDNISVVENGFLAGNDLNELIEVYMGDLLGDRVFEQHGEGFPLLIKLIDSNSWLSIQVHPGDELAQKRHQANGKTEMWYAMHADKGAKLISGFNRKVTKDEYMKNLQGNSLEDILNFEEVEKGDVFFIPAGRVHALGPGIVVAEIQQTSDLTYRIFDFNRIDEKGNPRQLHNDLALDAIDFTVYPDYKTHTIEKKNQNVSMVKSPFFTTNMLHFDKPVTNDYTALDSFVIYLCTEGSCRVTADDLVVQIKMGEAMLIPATMGEFNLIPSPSAKLLEIYVPD
jgi:mannose-6-phosphate isomerase